MYTIGQLAKTSALSRSTLLYYDSIGLFSPSGRSSSNYRTYTDADRARLEQICTYRRTGLSLRDIGRIMKTRGRQGLVPLLEKRLDELSREIRALRSQQHFIVKLFKNDRAISRIRVMDKGSWIKLLETAGLDEAARDKWHAEFERLAPEAHQDFLEALGIPVKEVALIRKYSRGGRRE
ncbi:MAG: MerR family transcriptional regulator [Nitrospirae bacterium GWD2_57_9]|nr:MAG: MerR family transcriptional regulator [Nitrospirae bacterium GWD2_57_9]OGW47100.1 MAG: MerR family transcriptional regulator [Nitrospirae bacterium GWC2_57_9]